MKIVVFTGAGVSAESGLSTFRDSDGLWANYRIEDVCTHEAIEYNREQVVRFYNERRREALLAQPNAAHLAIAALQEVAEVQVITQNVDNLHERAGSRQVLHLHGELSKLRSSIDETATVLLEGWEQPLDMRHADGSLLRPHIVFFGESVPMFDEAVRLVNEADVLVVVGTSLAVYPAASLVQYAQPDVPVYMVDPAPFDLSGYKGRIHHIRKKASEGVPELCRLLQHAL